MLGVGSPDSGTLQGVGVGSQVPEGLSLYAASFQGQAPLRRPCSPLLVAGQGSPA